MNNRWVRLPAVVLLAALVALPSSARKVESPTSEPPVSSGVLLANDEMQQQESMQGDSNQNMDARKREEERRAMQLRMQEAEDWRRSAVARSQKMLNRAGIVSSEGEQESEDLSFTRTIDFSTLRAATSRLGALIKGGSTGTAVTTGGQSGPAVVLWPDDTGLASLPGPPGLAVSGDDGSILITIDTGTGIAIDGDGEDGGGEDGGGGTAVSTGPDGPAVATGEDDTGYGTSRERGKDVGGTVTRGSGGEEEEEEDDGDDPRDVQPPEDELVDHQPVARPDLRVIQQGGSVSIHVISNDTFEDGFQKVMLVGYPRQGTATQMGPQFFFYRPRPLFTGTDRFSYILYDLDGDTDVATVTIEVGKEPDVDHPVIARPDSAAAKYNTPITITVIGNDEAEDGIGSVSVIGGPGGRLRPVGLGSFVYTPPKNFFGSDIFAYRLKDTDDDSDTAMVSISIGRPPKPKPKPPPPNMFGACLNEVRRMGLDPDAVLAQARGDEAVDTAYDQAFGELAPRDPSADAVADAQYRLSKSLVNAKTADAYDAAAMEFQDAQNGRRIIMDTLLEEPVKTFERLVDAAPLSPDGLAVHPLLDKSDVPAALRLLQAVRTPEIRRQIKKTGAILKKASSAKAIPVEISRRIDDIYLTIINPDPKNVRSFRVLTPEQSGVARQLVSRVAQSLPLADKLIGRAAKIGGKESPERVFSAMAQVFLAEVTGKDALMASRAIKVPAFLNSVGIKRQGKDIFKEIALDKDVDIVEMRRIEPLDRKRMALHRNRIEAAKRLRGDAHIAALRSAFAPRDERLAVDASVAAGALEQVAYRLKLPMETRVAAVQFPILRNALIRMRGKAAEVYKSGKLDRSSFSKLRADMTALDKDVRVQQAVLDGAAAAHPSLAAAVRRYLDADKASRARQARLRDDPAYAETVNKASTSNRAKYVRELQTTAARIGALPGPQPAQRLTGLDQIQYKGGNIARRVSAPGSNEARLPNTTAASKKAVKTLFKPILAPLPRRKGYQQPAISTEGRKRLVEWGYQPTAAESAERGWKDAKNKSRAATASGAPKPLKLPPDLLQQMRYSGRVPDMKDSLDPKRRYARMAASARSEAASDARRFIAPGKKAARDTGSVRSKGYSSGRPISRSDVNKVEFMERRLRERLNNSGEVTNYVNAGDAALIARGRSSRSALPARGAGIESALERRLVGDGWSASQGSQSKRDDQAVRQSNAYGMVHRREDLNDPEYYKELARSRLGGLGWVHEFKDLDELRDFAQSRLGGWGRAYTCLDLLRQGMSMERIEAIYGSAAAYGKRQFESDADYEARLLETYPDEYRRGLDGSLRRLSNAEITGIRRQRLLETGNYLIDPRSGNLVRRGTKAAGQILTNYDSQFPDGVSLELDNGRRATVSVDGRGSLRDNIEDALAAKGYYRDEKGDWVDADGNVVLSAARLEEYDNRYNNAINQRTPGLSDLLSYRSDDARPVGTRPPPPIGEQLDNLEKDLLDKFGFEITDLKLGRARIGRLEVRPGETVADAVRRALAADDRFMFDEFGDLIDRKTGKRVIAANDLEKIDRRYRQRAADAIFGKYFGGINDQVRWMAENGTVSQQIRARQILADLQTRAARLGQINDTRQTISEQMDAIRLDPALSKDERSLRLAKLQQQLNGIDKQRRDVESDLIERTRVANTSAQSTFENSLGFGEKDALRLNRQANEIADDIRGINDRLAGYLLPFERAQLERRRDRLQADLLKTSRKFDEELNKLKDPRRVGSFAKPINLREFDIDNSTVLDAGEARKRASDVGFLDDGRAVYLDAEGNVFKDPSGNPIIVSSRQGQRDRARMVEQLSDARSKLPIRQKKYNQAIDRLNSLNQQYAKLSKRQLKGTQGQILRRRITEAYDKATRYANEINSVVNRIDLLDDATRDRIERRSNEIVQERIDKLADYYSGRRSITYVDKDGVEKTYTSPKQRKYQDALERQRQLELALKNEKARKREETRRRKEEQDIARAKADKESAERETRKRVRQQLAQNQRERTSDFKKAENQYQSAREREAQALSRRDELESLLTSPRGNTKENRDAYAKAQVELAGARQEVLEQQRKTALRQAIAASGDPAFEARLNAQSAKIEESRKSFSQAREAMAAAEANYQAVKERVDAGELHPSSLVNLELAREALADVFNDAAGDLYRKQAIYDGLVETALYGGATPEYNRSRLDDLEQRVSAAGRSAREALTEEEFREFDKRTKLAEYHEAVGAARAKADGLRLLVARQRGGAKLSPKEMAQLDIGLTREERNLLIGDRQRQNLEEALREGEDLGGLVFERSMAEQYMLSADGRGGGSPLYTVGESGGSAFLESFSQAEVLNGRVKELEGLTASRQEDLDAARAAYEADNSDYNRTQLYYAERLVDSAENRLRKAKGDERLFAVQQKTRADDIEREIGFGDRAIVKARAEAAENQRQRQVDADRRASLRDTYMRGVKDIADLQAAHLERKEKTERRMGELEGNLTALERERQHYLQGVDTGTFTEEFAKKNISAIDRKISSTREVITYLRDTRLPGNDRTLAQDVQNIFETLPKPHEFDRAIAAQERRDRTAESLIATQEYRQYQQASQSQMQTMQERVSDLETALGVARQAEDAEAINRIEGDLIDAKTAFNDQSYFNEDRERRLRWDLHRVLRENREAGIGPGSENEVEAAIRDAGGNPDVLFAADAARISHYRNSGNRMVDGAIANDLGAPNQTMAEAFSEEMIGKDPLATALAFVPGATTAANYLGYDTSGAGRLALLRDPAWLAKATAGSFIGAGEHAGTIVKGAAELVYEVGDTVAEAVTANFLDKDYLGVGTENLDAINRIYDARDRFTLSNLSNLAGRMTDSYFDKLRRSKDLEWEVAKDGGALGLEIGLFFTGAGPVNTLRNVTVAGTRYAGRASKGLRALAATREALDATSRTARALRLAASTTDKVGDVLRGTNRVFRKYSQAVNRANDGLWRQIDKVTPDFVYNGRALSDREYDLLSRVGGQLAAAEEMTKRGLAGRGARASGLLDQAADLRRQAFHTVDTNPRIAGVIDELNQTRKLVGAQRNLRTLEQAAKAIQGSARVSPRVLAGGGQRVASAAERLRNIRALGRGAARPVPRTAPTPASRPPALSATPGDTLTPGIARARTETVMARVADGLDNLAVPAGMTSRQATNRLGRTLARNGVDGDTVSRAAETALARVDNRRRNLAGLQRDIRRSAERAGVDTADNTALGQALQRNRERLEALNRQASMLRGLRDNPAAGSTRVPDAPGDGRTLRFTPEDQATARAVSRGEAALAPPSRGSVVPGQRFPARDAPLTLRRMAERLRKEGAAASQVARLEELALRAERRVKIPKGADFQATLAKNPELERRMFAGGRLADDTAAAAAARVDIARFLDDTPNWDGFAAAMARDNEALGGRLIEFRQYVWDRLKKRFPNIEGTGSAGHITNDLDFSVMSELPAAEQIAIGKFLREGIPIGPGRNGLGPNWDDKLNMAALANPRLIHAYDRLPTDAARHRVRRNTFELAEAAEFDELRHTMPPDAFKRLTRQMGVDADAVISRNPRRPPEAIDDLLRARDDAMARYRDSGFTDAKSAEDVVRRQIEINRLDPEAYSTPGAVLQTVTFKEGLVPFREPLIARARNGDMVVSGIVGGGTPGLRVKFPSGRQSPSFNNVRELREFVKGLKAGPATIANSADLLAARRLLNNLERDLLKPGPTERYQSILSNIASFEHKVADAGSALATLRNYQSSKYASRVLSEADGLNLTAENKALLQEVRRMTNSFYRDRQEVIPRIFSAEATNLPPERIAELSREADLLLQRMRELHGAMAAAARRDARRAFALGDPKAVIRHGDDPAGFLRQTYGRKGDAAARAYRIAREELGDEILGVSGSFARGEARIFSWPDSVKSADDALRIDKLDLGLTAEQVSRLPAASRRALDIKRSMGGRLPSDLDIPTSATNVEDLIRAQRRIFRETGIQVEFVEPEFPYIQPPRAGPREVARVASGGPARPDINVPPRRAQPTIEPPKASAPGTRTASRASGAGAELPTERVGPNRVRPNRVGPNSGGGSTGGGEPPAPPSPSARPGAPGDGEPDYMNAVRRLREEADNRAQREIERYRRALDDDTEITAAAAERMYNAELDRTMMQGGLEDAVRMAREAGVPDAYIARNVQYYSQYTGEFGHYIRLDSIRNLERAALTRRGMRVLSPGDEDVAMASRLVINGPSGTATAEEVAYLRQRIAAAARDGRDYFDDLARTGVMDPELPFEVVATSDEILRLRNWARRQNLYPPPGETAGAARPVIGPPRVDAPKVARGASGGPRRPDIDVTAANIRRGHPMDRVAYYNRPRGAEDAAAMARRADGVLAELTNPERMGTSVLKGLDMERARSYIRANAANRRVLDSRQLAVQAVRDQNLPVKYRQLHRATGETGYLPGTTPATTPPGGAQGSLVKEARGIVDGLVAGDRTARRALENLDMKRVQAYLNIHARRGGVHPAQLAAEAVLEQDLLVNPRLLSAAGKVDKTAIGDLVSRARRRISGMDLILDREARNVINSAKKFEENVLAAERLAARQADAALFDPPANRVISGAGSRPTRQDGFRPGTTLVEGDAAYVQTIMRDSRFVPVQHYIHVPRVNKYARELIDGSLDWDLNDYSSPANIIMIGPQGQILQGHHRLVGGEIASQLTGRPLIGPRGSGAIIPEDRIHYWQPGNPTNAHIQNPKDPRGNGWAGMRVTVDAPKG